MGTLLAKNADVVVTMDGQRRELRNVGNAGSPEWVAGLPLRFERPAAFPRLLHACALRAPQSFECSDEKVT